MMKDRFALIGARLKTALSVVGDLIILNLLFLFCCVPVITIGAAGAACYSGVFRLVRNKETGMPLRTFFKDFGAVFKQATVSWLLMLLCLAVLAVDVWFATVYSEPDNKFFFIISILVAIALLLTALWFYPLVARFENTLGGHLKSSIALAFAQLPRTLLALLIWVIFLGAPMAFFAVFLYFGWFWLLCGLSLPMLITANLFQKALQLFPAADEQAKQD